MKKSKQHIADRAWRNLLSSAKEVDKDTGEDDDNHIGIVDMAEIAQGMAHSINELRVLAREGILPKGLQKLQGRVRKSKTCAKCGSLIEEPVLAPSEVERCQYCADPE